MKLPGSAYGMRPILRTGEPSVDVSVIDAASATNVEGEPYRLISIDAVHAPEGCTGADWLVYRIAQGKNGITGYRQGNLGRVSADLETIVAGLNGRRQWSTSSASSKKSQRRAAAAARRGAK